MSPPTYTTLREALYLPLNAKIRYIYTRSPPAWAQFELLPTTWAKSDLKKTKLVSQWVQNPKIGQFSNQPRDSFRLFFVGFCTVGKNSNYVSGETDFLLSCGHASLRDRGLIPRSVWLISSLTVKKRNMNTQKKSKLNRIKSDPDRNRPEQYKIMHVLFSLNTYYVPGIYLVSFAFLLPRSLWPRK